MIEFSNERINKIFHTLLNQKEPITVKELSDLLNKSIRTIRKDLKKIKKYASKENLNLVIKPNVGVWLEINEANLQEIIKGISDNSINKSQFNKNQRQNYVLKSVLSTNEYTVNDLAEELYVSRATIYKDLKEIENWLKKYDLELNKSNNGITIEGKEKNWRRFIADILVKFQKESQYGLIEELLPSSKIDSQTYHMLKELFDDINVKRIIETLEKILEQIEPKLGFELTDEAFTGLVIHLAISIERLRDNKSIVMREEQLNQLRDKDEFRIAKFIERELNEHLNINLPESEIGYMCLHIMGSKLQQNIYSTDMKDISDTVDPKIIEMANNIIEMAEKILGVELHDDKQLLNGLVLHLKPSINRLKYGLSLRNPILENIKENYPSVFGAAWATSRIFEEELGVQLKEEEVGYIALHLGAALERKSNIVNVAIVCGSGIGTAQLLRSRLEEYLNNINIMNSLSLHKVGNTNLENIDLIVSTVPIPNFNKKVVQVNPLLPEDDLNLLKDEINNINSKERKKLAIDKNRVNSNKCLYDKDLIFLDLNFKTKGKVIRYMSDELEKRNIISEEYFSSIMQREKLTSTELLKGIAIPHGDESKYVLKSKVAVATLSNSVEWSDKPNSQVDVIFLLALKDRETAELFFRNFNVLFENDNLLSKIKKAESKETVYRCLYNNLNQKAGEKS